MAASGDGTDPSAAIEELRRQMARLGKRLNDLEKVELPMLKRQLREQDEKRADEQRHYDKEQQEAKRRTKLVRQRIEALDAVLVSALTARGVLPVMFGHIAEEVMQKSSRRVTASVVRRCAGRSCLGRGFRRARWCVWERILS